MSLSTLLFPESRTSSVTSDPSSQENSTENIFEEIFLHNPFVVAAWCCTTFIIAYLISKFSFLTIKGVKEIRRHSKRKEIRRAARRNQEEHARPLIEKGFYKWKRCFISIIHFPLICIRFAFAVNPTLSWSGILFFLNMFSLLLSVTEGQTENGDREFWSLFYIAIVVLYYLLIYFYYIFGERGEFLSVLPPSRTASKRYIEACDKYQDFSSGLFETFMVGLSQMLLIAMYILATLGVFGTETPDWNPTKSQEEIDAATYYILGMVVQLGYVLTNGQLEKFIQNWTFWNMAWEWLGNTIEFKDEEGDEEDQAKASLSLDSETKNQDEEEEEERTEARYEQSSAASYYDAEEFSEEWISNTQKEDSVLNLTSSEDQCHDAVAPKRYSLESFRAATTSFLSNTKIIQAQKDDVGLEESLQGWDIEGDFRSGCALDYEIDGAPKTSEEMIENSAELDLEDVSLQNEIVSPEGVEGSETIQIPEPVITEEDVGEASESNERHDNGGEKVSTFFDLIIALETKTKKMDNDRKNSSTKVISKLDFWVRFIFATVVNGIGFWIILLLLPHQLAKSSDPVDFVLNSVAAYFIIEMDDLDNEIRFENKGKQKRDRDDVDTLASHEHESKDDTYIEMLSSFL